MVGVMGGIQVGGWRLAMGAGLRGMHDWKALAPTVSGGKMECGLWGEGSVAGLALYIQHRQPGIRGFSAQNLWRMRQVFAACRATPILSPLLRELPWTHNLIILGQSKKMGLNLSSL